MLKNPPAPFEKGGLGGFMRGVPIVDLGDKISGDFETQQSGRTPRHDQTWLSFSANR